MYATVLQLLALEIALHIRFTGRAEDVDQPGPAQIVRDDFPDKSDLAQQTGELAGRLRMLGLASDDKAA